MALVDALIEDLASRFGLGANAGPLVQEVLNYVTGSPGGLSGFLDKLKTAGFGSEMESWLGHADASPMSAQLMERVVGSNALGGIASRLGLGTSLVSTAVGYALPRIIGLLTPGGTISASIPQEIRSFLSSPTTQRFEPTPHIVEQVAPRHMEVIHDQPHMAQWMWPLLGALGILGLGSYLFSTNYHTPGPAVVQAPALPPAPPTPTMPPRLALSNDNGVIHYSGTVHDEETRTSIINALKAEYGADKISGDIGIDLNRGAAPWLVNLRATFGNFKTPGVQAQFDGNSINLGGVVSDADRDRIASSLKGILGTAVAFGALSDKMADLVSSANTKAVAALASLKTGFESKDLVGILNQSIINFPSGGADVPTAAASLLQDAANDIKEMKPGTVLEIAAYTDNVGDSAANMTLSQQRADAVRNVLIQDGVSPSMLVAKGYGSANPVASNDLLEGRFRNRRIEYHLVKS